MYLFLQGSQFRKLYLQEIFWAPLLKNYLPHLRTFWLRHAKKTLPRRDPCKIYPSGAFLEPNLKIVLPFLLHNNLFKRFDLSFLLSVMICWPHSGRHGPILSAAEVSVGLWLQQSSVVSREASVNQEMASSLSQQTLLLPSNQSEWVGLLSASQS